MCHRASSALAQSSTVVSLRQVADLDELYDRVVAAPAADEPREAFAAAVGRADPDRAEFIRLQLAMARARVERVDSYPMSIRAGILRDHHHERWAHPVKDLVRGYQFLRGFVDLVAIDAEVFLMFSEDLYRRAPVLHLDLTGAQDVPLELFDDPHLERIVSLTMTGCGLGDAEAIALASSPHLAALEWLDLSGNAIGTEGLEALAASPTLNRLGFLGFRDNAEPDPTPVHADAYDATTPAALALQQRYGRREWLDAYPRGPWPPERDAVWPHGPDRG